MYVHKVTWNDGTNISETHPLTCITTMGKVDNSGLMMIIRWAIDTSFQSLNGYGPDEHHGMKFVFPHPENAFDMMSLLLRCISLRVIGLCYTSVGVSSLRKIRVKRFVSNMTKRESRALRLENKMYNYYAYYWSKFCHFCIPCRTNKLPMREWYTKKNIVWYCISTWHLVAR